MNGSQRIVLFVTAFALVAMLLFSPFKSQYLQGDTVNAGYAFILTPPAYKLANGTYKAQVDSGLLGLQLVAIGAAGWIVFLALKSIQVSR